MCSQFISWEYALLLETENDLMWCACMSHTTPLLWIVLGQLWSLWERGHESSSQREKKLEMSVIELEWGREPQSNPGDFHQWMGTPPRLLWSGDNCYCLRKTRGCFSPCRSKIQFCMERLTANNLRGFVNWRDRLWLLLYKVLSMFSRES